MVTEFIADLYSRGDTALVVTEGFAFKATHDACVKVVDGTIFATKFGLKSAGPGYVKRTKNDVEEYGSEMYDRIKKDIQLELYYGDKYYIPTTLDRVFHTQSDYAVYDTNKKIIYRVKFDDVEDNVYNLVGIKKNTIQKVDDLESYLGYNSRYIPLVGIKNKV